MQSVTSNAVAEYVITKNLTFSLNINAFNTTSSYPIRVRKIGNIVYVSGLVLSKGSFYQGQILTINDIHINNDLLLQHTYWDESQQKYLTGIFIAQQSNNSVVIMNNVQITYGCILYLDVSFVVD